jgi:hypothetical protein
VSYETLSHIKQNDDCLIFTNQSQSQPVTASHIQQNDDCLIFTSQPQSQPVTTSKMTTDSFSQASHSHSQSQQAKRRLPHLQKPVTVTASHKQNDDYLIFKSQSQSQPVTTSKTTTTTFSKTSQVTASHYKQNEDCLIFTIQSQPVTTSKTTTASFSKASHSHSQSQQAKQRLPHFHNPVTVTASHSCAVL